MRKPWSLYNIEDKLRVDDLTAEQVRIVLLATASSRMSHWYACQEGDLHWQPIIALTEFYEDVRQIKGGPQSDDHDKEISITRTDRQLNQGSSRSEDDAVPSVVHPRQRRPLFEDAPEEKSNPTLQVDLTSTKERRSARRYPRCLAFKVSFDNKVFQCETVDISMVGISLEQDLPAWVPKTFSAELSLNNHSINVMCFKVSDKKLKLKESSSWDVIRAWIVNW